MRISELVTRFGLEPQGPIERDFEIAGVKTLGEAGPDDLSFLSNPRYRASLLETKAGAVLIQTATAGTAALQLQCANPYATLARVLQLLYPEPVREGFIHPTAHVDPSAQLGAHCYIGPGCVVEAGCVLGEGVALVANVTVMDGCHIDSGCKLFPGVVLYPHVQLGKQVRIHANSVIGSDGFGYAQDAGQHVKVPQIGRVVIGDECEIGSNVSIDRGSLSDTLIGKCVKIDNLVQIAHGVVIGDASIIVSQTGISGSAKLGKYVVLAGKVGVTGHLEIGDQVTVMGASVVTKNLAAGAQYAGNPAIPHLKYQKQLAHSRRLGEYAKRIKALEDQLSNGDSSD